MIDSQLFLKKVKKVVICSFSMTYEGIFIEKNLENWYFFRIFTM
jgi:hypothetical protein